MPRIDVALVRDRTSTAAATGGFLDVRRLDLAVRWGDHDESAPFAFDIAVRRALDVAVIVPHFVDGGIRHVYLRSSVRPSLAFGRSPAVDTGMWELPAGLIDPGETPAEAAARELEEELGFALPAASMRPLGPFTYPVPGMCAERHCLFEVEVDPAVRRDPSEDGSALERGALIVTLPLADALVHCAAGALRDAKTELALRRLTERLATSERGTP